jgi:Putative Ig domain
MLMRETHPILCREPPAMGIQSSHGQDRAQAVAELLKTKSLITTLRLQREYEVWTTIVTRQIWRYRCRVLRDGKEMRRGRFRAMAVDRSRQIRKEPAVTEELRVAFATEAVEAHFARCAMVAEYALRAPSSSLPPFGRYRPRPIALRAVILISLLSVFWFWSNPSRVRPQTLPAHSPPPMVEWEQAAMAYQLQADEAFTVPRPTRERTTTNVPVTAILDPPGERADQRVPPPPIAAEPSAPDAPADTDAEPPFAHSPPSTVAWHQAATSYQLAADEPFTIPLPTLERTPASVPVEVTLEPLGDKPSWLTFDQEHSQLSGTTPRATKNETYALIFRAKVENGNESHFQLALTIMAETTPLLSPRQNSPEPILPNRPADANCLLKILQGEPCQKRSVDADCLLKALQGEPCQSR